MEPKQTHYPYRHAIVIGGSIAGLLVSRVLSDYFDCVTLIDRDATSGDHQSRKRVPQDRHIHVLHRSGKNVMAKLFPSLFDDLQKAGAVPIDLRNIRWFHYGFWKNRAPSGLIAHTQTRPFLEQQVRRRITGLESVHILDTCEVTRLLLDADRVSGVRIRRRCNPMQETDLKADLVVDATGRGSRTPHWLESLGYTRPEETTVAIDLGYASRLYRPSKDDTRDWIGMAVHPYPPFESRGGVIASVEGGRWIATAMGYFGDHPPADDRGFLQFARRLSVPDFYRAIKDAEPLTPISIYKFPTSIRRHYERLTHFPEGLIVVGDALCSFNPVYGQGMSVCALSVDVLDACLKEQISRPRNGLTGFARRYFKQVSRVIDAAWMWSKCEDFSYPQTKGKRPLGIHLLSWYKTQVYELSAQNTAIQNRIVDVLLLQKSPLSLFHPSVVFRAVNWGMGFGHTRMSEASSAHANGVSRYDQPPAAEGESRI